jgi:uncharacterized protein YkwD
LGLLVLAGLAAVLLTAPASAHANTCIGAGENLTNDIPRSERSLLCLTNIYRVANGAGPLAMDPILRTTARAYSEDMHNRNFFNHFGGPGCDDAQATAHTGGCNYPWDRAMASGFPSDQVSENIARGFLPTPDDVFSGFRNSPGHNANMLDPAWVTVGMGIAGGAHVTENFSSYATGATDTAVDLLITDACAAAQKANTPLEERVAKEKKQLAKAKKKAKDGGSPRVVARERKQLKGAKKALAAGVAKEKAQCRPPTHY